MFQAVLDHGSGHAQSLVANYCQEAAYLASRRAQLSQSESAVAALRKHVDLGFQIGNCWQLFRHLPTSLD